jgi:hypothetical protein
MTRFNIDDHDIEGMINHWISTPENAYLGSSYGYRSQLLQATKSSQNQQTTNDLIKKAKNDIPFLADADMHISWQENSGEMCFTVNGRTSIHALVRAA